MACNKDNCKRCPDLVRCYSVKTNTAIMQILDILQGDLSTFGQDSASESSTIMVSPMSVSSNQDANANANTNTERHFNDINKILTNLEAQTTLLSAQIRENNNYYLNRFEEIGNGINAILRFCESNNPNSGIDFSTAMVPSNGVFTPMMGLDVVDDKSKPKKSLFKKIGNK